MGPCICRHAALQVLDDTLTNFMHAKLHAHHQQRLPVFTSISFTERLNNPLVTYGPSVQLRCVLLSIVGSEKTKYCWQMLLAPSVIGVLSHPNSATSNVYRRLRSRCARGYSSLSGITIEMEVIARVGPGLTTLDPNSRSTTTTPSAYSLITMVI